MDRVVDATERTRAPDPEISPSKARTAAPVRPNLGAMLALQRAAGNRAVGAFIGQRNATTGPGQSQGQSQEKEAPPTDIGAAPSLAENARDLGSPDDAEPQADAPVQRIGDGLLAGIRGRLEGVIGRVRGAWTNIQGSAGAMFNAAAGRVSEVTGSIARAGGDLVDRARGGWSRLTDLSGSLMSRLTGGLTRLVGGVQQAAGGIRRALVDLDIDGARSAWSRVRSAMSTVQSWTQATAGSVLGAVSSGWTNLQTGFTGAMGGAQRLAQRSIEGVSAFVDGAGARLANAWNGVSQAAQRFSEFTGVPAIVRAVVDRLLVAGRSLWSGVQQGWSALRERAAAMADRAKRAVQGAWDRAREAAGAVRERLGAQWASLREGFGRRVDGLTGGVRTAWARVSSFDAGAVFGRLAQGSRLVRAIRQGLANPDAALAPVAGAVTSKLESEMPGRAQQESQTRLGPRLAAVGDGGAPMPAQRQAAGDMVVQREARSTAYGSILDEVGGAIAQKWSGVKVGPMVVHALKTLLWPWPAVGAEFSGMMADWRRTAGSLFSIRTTGIGAFFHDLWSNILHLFDFPMILVRRLVAVCNLLMGWVTFGLVILGAIGGTVIGGVIGGIASAAVSLGLAAPAGAGAGATLGGGTGAMAGLGTALAIGEGLMIAFLAAEAATIVKTFADLLTARQTDEEKAHDFNQVADSLIGVGAGLVMLALSFIGARIAGAAMRGLRRIRPGAPKETPPPTPSEPPRPAVVPTRVTLRELMGEARYVEYEAALGAVKSEHPHLQGIPTDDLIAIRGYTDNDWARLNAALRLQDRAALAELEPQIRHATSGLRALPSHRGPVTRTVSFSEDMVAQYRPGEIITEHGFTSTTVGGSVAQREGNFLMMITSSTGKDVRLISRFPLENEVLFLPGTRFRVVEVFRSGQGGLIRMVEVP